MPKPATVRALALDGTWESVGIDRAAGIWMENLLPEYDGWGPSKCTFDLRRQSSRPWPDIGAFTPIEVEIAGQDVWVGRVGDTPSRDGQERAMTVQCEGAQFVLDDDLYRCVYVHNKLADYKDQRSFGIADLTVFGQSATVNSGDGVILLGWAKGAQVNASQRAAVVLDLGPDCAAWKVVVDYEGLSANASHFLYAMLVDVEYGSGLNAIQYDQAGGVANNTSGQIVVTGTQARRYVHIWSQYTGTGTLSADAMFRIKGVRVFGDPAYESGNQSILKASQIVNDGLDKATSGLSADRSLISSTITPIPTYVTDGPITPRTSWLAADAFHDWVKKIDQYRRPVYKAKPASPLFEIASTAPGEFNDTSANSGDDIYNRTILTGTDTAGRPLATMRRQQGDVGAFAFPAPVQPSNPSFDTNLTGWTGDQISRSTSVFDSSPASLLLTSATIPGAYAKTLAFTGDWASGVQYVLRMTLRRAYAGSGGISVEVVRDYGVLGANLTSIDSMTWAVDPAFIGYQSPPFRIDDVLGEHGTMGIQIAVNAPLAATGTPLVYIDSLQLLVARPTLVDRRLFRRTKELPINATLPADLVAANIIADTWLTGHRTTPFKGTRTLIGDGSIRDLRTGQSIGLHTLGNKTMEMVRFADHVDPDTGGLGRDGRMTEVKYRHAEDTAEITIDNSRASFEALLARFGVAVGS